MKRFKKASFVLSTALLVGFVTFSACKKDKDDDEVTAAKAAEEVCNCYSKAGDDVTAVSNCLTAVVTKYQSQFAKTDWSVDFYKEVEKCAGE